METQVVVAVISAVGSIAVAVVAGRKEAKRVPLKSGHVRPLLTFAATGALLLSLTVLGVTLYLQSLPRLGYQSVSVVIYSGVPDDVGWGTKGLPSSNSESEPKLAHSVDMKIPAGGRIVGAWYTPEDAIGGLPNFASINVELLDDSHVKLILGGKNGINTHLRIRLHAAYTQ